MECFYIPQSRVWRKQEIHPNRMEIFWLIDGGGNEKVHPLLAAAITSGKVTSGWW